MRASMFRFLLALAIPLGPNISLAQEYYFDDARLIEIIGKKDAQVIEIIGRRLPRDSIPVADLVWYLPNRLGDTQPAGRPINNSPIVSTPASDGNSEAPEDECKSPVGKLPVVYATGEKVLPQLDFDNKSLLSLALVRTYRSTQSSSSMFGPNWSSSLDYPSLGSSQYISTIRLTLPSGGNYT